MQDFRASEGDRLIFGAVARADQFQVNFAATVGAGMAAIAEAFVIYRPTGQVLWALVDGQSNAEITLQTASGTFDLLGQI